MEIRAMTDNLIDFRYNKAIMELDRLTTYDNIIQYRIFHNGTIIYTSSDIQKAMSYLVITCKILIDNSSVYKVGQRFLIHSKSNNKALRSWITYISQDQSFIHLETQYCSRVIHRETLSQLIKDKVYEPIQSI